MLTKISLRIVWIMASTVLQVLSDPLYITLVLLLIGTLHAETAAVVAGIFCFSTEISSTIVFAGVIGTAVSAPLRRRLPRVFSDVLLPESAPKSSTNRLAVEFPFASLSDALRASKWSTMPALRLIFAVFLRTLLWSALLAALTVLVLKHTTDGPTDAAERLAGLLLLAPVAAVTLRAVVGRFVRHLLRN